MRHAFDIPAMTKSRFGKNKSYEVLTPDLRYVINASIIMRTHVRANIHTQRIALAPIRLSRYYNQVTSSAAETY